MKKLKIFQITIIVLFIIFIFFLFRSVDYTKEYTIDDVKIVESYNKERKHYYFTLTYHDITFDYLYESKMEQQRTLINEVEIIEDDENFCLIPKGDSLEFIPLCIDNNKVTHYTKVNDQLKEQIPDEYLNASKELDEEYEGINIYNKDYTYLLWNYNGFYYINEEYTEELTLFDQELYNANLITYTEDYLIVADYDEEYTFNKFYRIAFKDGKIKEFNLNRDIYFDSYFPGYVKNKLYIVDNKEKEMYEFNAKNGDLEKIKPKMLNNDEWENVGIKSLISQNKKFSKKTNYEYNLDGDILYLNYQGKENNTVIDDEVTSIVRIKDNLIFYLKTDTLYAFDPLKGSTKLLKYFEWNFNYENMIYIN